MIPEIESLLLPITPDNPAGDNLEDEILFSTISNARESDQEYLLQGEWSFSEPRKADWDKVAQLCSQALKHKSKDLQLACWFVEAQSHRKGLAGLCSSAEFLSEFITRFWFQFWPSLEEDGVAIRRSKLVRLDRDISQYIYCIHLLQHETTSLYYWQLIQNFEHKIKSRPSEREALIQQEGDLTKETFELQATNFSSDEILLQLERVNHLQSVFQQLEIRYYSLSQDTDNALFTLTKQKLQDSAEYLQRLLPQYSGDKTDINSASNELVHEKINHAVLSSTQPLNREQAIRQMLNIATWFRQAEPTSPVPFLMERAARWANMTLTEWLEEMLTDSNSMQEIKNILTGQK